MLHKNQSTREFPIYRPIRSFVRREGRMTRGQKIALQRLWPRYGIDVHEDYLDLDMVFGRHAPCMLEIGLGMGDSLIEMACNHPENDYLGVEVYRPGVGSLLSRLDECGIGNVRVINNDAKMVLQQMIPEDSISAVYIFFPDPWPKKRHHKRRLIQPSFIELLSGKLKPGGMLHMATDWEDYAHHMIAVMNHASMFANTAGGNHFSPRLADRPLTKFEQRGMKLGHEVWDLVFRKTA
jgi:tRNA (guanine-N7-)-methyltransferase